MAFSGLDATWKRGAICDDLISSRSLEEWTAANAAISKEPQSLVWAKKEGLCAILQVWAVCLFSSMLRHGRGMVLFLSSSVTSHSGLVWCRCSMQLSVQQENTMAPLWGPGQLPAVRACCFLSRVLTAPVFTAPRCVWCLPGSQLTCWLLSLPPWQLSAFSGLLGPRSDFQIFVAFSLCCGVLAWSTLPLGAYAFFAFVLVPLLSFRGHWGESSGRWLHPHSVCTGSPVELSSGSSCQRPAPHWGPLCLIRGCQVSCPQIPSLMNCGQMCEPQADIGIKKVPILLFNENCILFCKHSTSSSDSAARAVPSWGHLMDSFVFQSGFPMAESLYVFLSGAINIFAS